MINIDYDDYDDHILKSGMMMMKNINKNYNNNKHCLTLWLKSAKVSTLIGRIGIFFHAETTAAATATIT